MMEEKDMRLEAAVEYGLDEFETLAYQCCLIWLDTLRRYFPNLRHVGLRQGDPRKSLLFRYCFTLLRKTKGILSPAEMPLYIRAQLDILRHITRGNEHPDISPAVLVGEKAWVRWKLWKKKYDERTKVIEDQVPVPPSQIKMAEALDRTKEFLVQTLSGEISVEKFKEAVVNKNFLRWINLGKISPYYLVLSPLVAQAVPDLDKMVSMDLDVFRQILTPEIRAYFAKMFSNEVQDEKLLSELRPGA